MKKNFLFVLLFVLGIIVISSCQSRGHKCPGMYSQVDTNTSIYYQNID
jgi:hypothetical protein